jgi:hypothetical protein
MYQYYSDILSAATQSVQWFDEHGVPRFCAFSPERIADFYAKECALLKVACQECGEENLMCVSRGSYDSLHLAGRLLSRSSFGDPPNTNCCAAGPTMTADVLAVVQFWERGPDLIWRRNPKLEIFY